MRAQCLAGLGFLLFYGGLAHAEPRFPYELKAGGRGLEVYSGPGKEFYATERLPTGTKIEVHRREAGGWLAIRPPAGSYSWIRQSQVQRTNEPNTAKVVEDGALCRVGSRLVRPSAHVCQVRLRKDELIEVLEEQKALDADNSGAEEVWCRIAPPAGEFRYVLAEDLPQNTAFEAVEGSPTVPARTAASTSVPARPSAPDGTPIQPRPMPETETIKTPEDPKPAASPEAGAWQPRLTRQSKSEAAPVTDHGPETQEPIKIVEPIPRISRPAKTRTDAAGASEPASQAAAAETPQVPIDAAMRQKTSEPAASGAPAAQPAAADGKVGDEATSWTARDKGQHEDLRQIDLELSLMVAREVKAWRLESLRKRVEAILAKVSQDHEKAQATHLLKRIREFEDLENRLVHAGLDSLTGAGIDPRNAVVGASAGAVVVGANTRFDGTGWLVAVHSGSRAAPPYALLNAEGDVLQYVSPSPGLNLHRYERKQVGLYGQRSHLPSVNKPHLTAERVVDLERHLR